MIKKNKKDKAQAILLGFIILVGILSLGYYTYLTESAPIEKQQNEVDHFGDVSSDLIQFRDNIVEASESGSTTSQSLELGRDYNTILPVPPEEPIVGQISVKEYDSPIKIYNASGLGGAKNYWPGTTKPCETPKHCYSSSYIKYTPHYKYYLDHPETYYENSIMYDNYGGQRISKTGQSLVNGRDIKITTIKGDINISNSDLTNTQIVPVSAPSQEIQITDRDEPVKIQVPTNIPVQKWRQDLLNNQLSTNSQNGYIKSISEINESVIEIEMIQGETYTLELSKLYLTTQTSSQTIPSQKPSYVSWTGSENVEIEEDSTERIPTQVRDKYNNPVSGVPVEVYARDQEGDCVGSFQSANTQGCSNSAFQPGTKQSGEDGRAIFFYESPEVQTNKRISIRIGLGSGATSTSYSPKKKVNQN
jgi:hypothetical protein